MSLVDSIPGTSARKSSTSKQVFCVWGCVLAVLAGWWMSKGWIAAAAVAGALAAFLLVSAIRPSKPLAGLAAKAARFSDQAAELLSRVVLGLWYYVIFTPVALIWRLSRKARPEREGWWREFDGERAPRFDRPF
jgi:hypothetical protein